MSEPFRKTDYGPARHDGKLFRIVWEIVARADLPLARDQEETKTFVVARAPMIPRSGYSPRRGRRKLLRRHPERSEGSQFAYFEILRRLRASG
jgi:hypothetical protein